MKTKAVLASLLCYLPLSNISTGGPVPDFPFIHVKSQAKREVPPTKAFVRFSILAFSKTSEEATDTVQTSLAKLLTVLRELGIKDDQIQAGDYEKSSSRTRPDNSFQSTEILGYQVSRTVMLKLPDLTKYPQIARTLMSAEHLTEFSSSFDTDKREEVLAELASEACAKARKKADLLAKGAGVLISGVHAVGEPEISDIDEHYGFSPSAVSAGGPFDETDAEAPVFVPATVEIGTRVAILYTLAK